MMKCNDGCSRCGLNGKAICPNKVVVINSSVDINNDDDIKEFVRGTRAKLPMIDDDWCIPREVTEYLNRLLRKE